MNGMERKFCIYTLIKRNVVVRFDIIRHANDSSFTLCLITVPDIQRAVMPSMSHPVGWRLPLQDYRTTKTVTTTALNTTSPKMVSCQIAMEWLRMAAGHLQWRVLLLSWWSWPTNLCVEAPWSAARQTICCHTSHIQKAWCHSTSTPSAKSAGSVCENYQATWVALSQDTIRNWCVFCSSHISIVLLYKK